MNKGNLFSPLPDASGKEIFDPLLKTENILLERIVSKGQATPKGEWYDQEKDEWVVLLKGGAGLLIEGQEVMTLVPGDHVFLPAHCRHRVEWTVEDEVTVWLALHVDSPAPR